MNPLSDLRKEISQRYFARLFEDVIGYLNLYDHLKLKIGDATGKTRRVSIETFWFSLLGDKFAHPETANFLPLSSGNFIKFKDVFLTDWAPKLPGQIWTETGLQDFKEGQTRIDQFLTLKTGEKVGVLDPDGKEKTISAGFGTVRIQPDTSDDKYCTLLNLVSDSSWHCDYGVPVVVSRSVYNEYLKYSKHGAARVSSIEGVLHIHQELPFKTFIPSAIGATLSLETERTLRYRPNLPKCFLYVASQVSVKFKENSSHPPVTAWTMFETDSPRNKYRYTYVQFDPTEQDGFDEANDFIKWYVKEYQGTQIVTDYDGLVPRLQASIPISANPMKKKQREVRNLISSLDRWVTKFVRQEIGFHRIRK